MNVVWLVHSLKRVLMVAGFWVLFVPASPAAAWTETYSWATDPVTTSYKIEKSADSGLTWIVVTSTLTTPSFVYTGTEAGLTLFRVSNCNASGCTVRLADGLWHNEAWRAPAGPFGLGAQ